MPTDGITSHSDARFLFVVNESKNKSGIQFTIVKNVIRSIGITISEISWTDLSSENLLEEVSQHLVVVPIGKDAIKHFVGEHANSRNYRGRPIKMHGKTFFPLQSVQECITREEYMDVMRNDMLRMNLISLNGGNKWVEPIVKLRPSTYEIEDFLNESNMDWTFDIEVDGINPNTCKIRCIAIGNVHRIIVIPFLSLDGKTKFYTPMELLEINSMLITFFSNTRNVFCGHNVMMFDSIVLKNQLGINIEGIFDTMVAHSVIHSRLPHDLGFCASYYTFAPNWKAERKLRLKSNVPETDDELHQYCAYDVSITSMLTDKMMGEIRVQDLQLPVRFYMDFQRKLTLIYQKGIYVDLVQLRKIQCELENTLNSIQQEICEALKVESFNPNSGLDVGTLLFDTWETNVNTAFRLKVKKDGLYSITDILLKACACSRGLEKWQRSLIEKIRLFRKTSYLKTVQIGQLRKMNMDKKHRIHPDFNVHSTSNHSLSHPLAKFPKIALACLKPTKGSVYLQVTLHKLDLVTIANMLSCETLQEMLHSSSPAKELTKMVMPKKDRISNKLIQLITTVFRCTAYDMNSEETYVHVSLVEDADGRICFPMISLREIRVIQQKIHEEFKFSAMQILKRAYNNDGYIQDIIVKRKINYSDNIVKDVLESAQIGLFNFYLSNLLKRIKNDDVKSRVVYFNTNRIVLECPKNEFSKMKKFVTSGLDIFDITIGEYCHMLSLKRIKNLGDM